MIFGIKPFVIFPPSDIKIFHCIFSTLCESLLTNTISHLFIKLIKSKMIYKEGWEIMLEIRMGSKIALKSSVGLLSTVYSRVSGRTHFFYEL